MTPPAPGSFPGSTPGSIENTGLGVQGKPRKRLRGCGGTAMIETVLALPFLLVIFALVIFVGFSMVRLQKAASVDRYEGWRAQAYAPGPEARPILAGDGAVERYDTRELRQVFYAGDPVRSLGVRSDAAYIGGVDTATAALVEAVEADRLEKRYAEALLTEGGEGSLPRSRVVRLTTEHAARSRFERAFSSAMSHDFGRADGDWRYINDVLDLPKEVWFDRRSGGVELPLYGGAAHPQRVVTPSIAVRGLAMDALDEVVAPLARINPVAAMMQDFYLRVPGYRGPKLPGDWTREGGLGFGGEDGDGGG